MAPRPALLVWGAQFETLVKKNVSILWHRKVTTLLFVVLPAAFILGLAALHSSLPTATTADVPLVLQRCSTFTVYGRVRAAA